MGRGGGGGGGSVQQVLACCQTSQPSTPPPPPFHFPVPQIQPQSGTRRLEPRELWGPGQPTPAPWQCWTAAPPACSARQTNTRWQHHKACKTFTNNSWGYSVSKLSIAQLCNAELSFCPLPTLTMGGRVRGREDFFNFFFWFHQAHHAGHLFKNIHPSSQYTSRSLIRSQSFSRKSVVYTGHK